MKKNFIYTVIAILSLGMVSCEALFDNLEGDLSKMTKDDMVASEAGLDRLVARLYTALPIDAFGTGDFNTTNANDTHSPSYGTGGVQGFWNYTTMRSANQLIKDLEEAFKGGIIAENTYKTMLGEALFCRAYYYFASVRSLGGVPLVTEPLDDKYDGGENAGLYIPRSTEKATWDFVLAQFQEAADLLPETRSTGKYRADKWAALGMKARAALYAGSVSKYWNKKAIPNTYKAVQEKLTYMEASYADAYYSQAIEAAAAIINSGKFFLYGAEPKSEQEAIDNFTNLFQDRQDGEWIFGQSYKNGVATNTNEFDYKYGPHQVHSTGTSAWQWGRYSVSLDLADIYDNYDANHHAVDGKIKTRVDGNESNPVDNYAYSNYLPAVGELIAYDELDGPFVNKDARFKASVIYPGIEFRGEEIIIQGGLIDQSGKVTYHTASTSAVGKDGNTYYGLGAANEADFSGFNKIGNTNDGNWYSTGFGIRKFLKPGSATTYTQNPWYDLRYAEILLTYAEAAVEKSTPVAAEVANAKTYLNQIRRRAYFLDTVEPTIDEILKQRRAEFAFENDYSYTLHRRRDFYQVTDGDSKEGARTHAIVPLIDLRLDTPKYIFVRANSHLEGTIAKPATNNVDVKAYYSGINNYVKNKITPNPSQE